MQILRWLRVSNVAQTQPGSSCPGNHFDKSVIQDGKRLATTSSMNAGKLFVYLLRSESQPDRYYTGLTSDVDARLQAHNAGRFPTHRDRKTLASDRHDRIC
jgi:GIY-YIG catalytic domain